MGSNQSVTESQSSGQMLEQLNDKIMRALARTIDAKDRYTNGHSQRVAKYARELAARMGKTGEEQMDIYRAGLLHDVGKIHIPDTILNKPGRLTDEEFGYIKLHPISGYYILKDIDENFMMAQGAKWHHERYDGSGYPNGLVGRDIPEVARIIGVADAYDAMTSNRSYRVTMTQEAVRKEIENGRGVQFDPEIADIMLGMIDEDAEYRMKQKDEGIRTILAVDDEPVNLELISFILENQPKYSVLTARSGERALKILSEVAVDLVLLDIQMPVMDGFETSREIRKISNAPVVFLTADRNFETIDRARRVGIEDYLVKPFMPQALLEILRCIFQEEADV